ncbi:hypothetical protein AMTR_s00013p00226810 [Amborella trichopoda]|uniref:Uncharacterized protein n=1 Tax=Amborella trichopoda TaxID=13333 RepID=W1PQB1_AMBTC|nr:hypothetical protein AMTR_s00013p00226810 [Amborella trichopoda]
MYLRLGRYVCSRWCKQAEGSTWWLGQVDLAQGRAVHLWLGRCGALVEGGLRVEWVYEWEGIPFEFKPTLVGDVAGCHVWRLKTRAQDSVLPRRGRGLKTGITRGLDLVRLGQVGQVCASRV